MRATTAERSEICAVGSAFAKLRHFRHQSFVGSIESGDFFVFDKRRGFSNKIAVSPLLALYQCPKLAIKAFLVRRIDGRKLGADFADDSGKSSPITLRHRICARQHWEEHHHHCACAEKPSHQIAAP
jgi:hypothetical protein